MTSVNDVDRALRAAPPHALLDTLRPLPDGCLGGDDADLLLADYGMTVLQPVEEPGDPRVPCPCTTPPRAGPSAARSRTRNTPGTPNGRVCICRSPPGASAWASSPSCCPGARGSLVTDDLAQVAELLGHAIVVAERDTDVYRQARRVGRLTLAAEMQWELLPGPGLCLRGVRGRRPAGAPAYAVRGDNFDWSSDAHRLTLSIINGMGDGIHASLLTHLAVGALRNARRAGLPVADQARLADQALYAQHHGDQTCRRCCSPSTSPPAARSRWTRVRRWRRQSPWSGSNWRQLPAGRVRGVRLRGTEFGVLPVTGSWW